MVEDIDRTKTCPFLLRCFWSEGRCYPLSSFREARKDILPSQEIQIYTWRDATLKEISDLLRDAIPYASAQYDITDAVLDLNCVYFQGNGELQTRRIGRVSGSQQEGSDDNKVLGLSKFTIGDFINVAVLDAGDTIATTAPHRDVGRRGNKGGRAIKSANRRTTGQKFRRGR